MKPVFKIAVAVFVAGGFLTLGFAIKRFNEFHPAPVPSPLMPYPNAFDTYQTAISRMTYGAGKNEPNLVKLPFAKRELLVHENAASLDLMRQAFALPYQPPPARSINDKFSYYAPQRYGARLFAADASIKAKQGDWSGAINSSLDAIEEGTQITYGSPMMGSLFGLACQAIGRRAAWPLVEHLNVEPSRTATRRMEKLVSSQEPFSQMTQEDVWFNQGAMREMIYTPKFQAPGFIKRIAYEHLTKYDDAEIANARRSYAARLPPPPEPAGIFDFISGIFLTYSGHLRVRDTDSQTQNALLETTLALRTYKLEHGVYPGTLDALVPRYLTAVPADPFALSAPLRYKLQSKQYLLYSVGPDGKDDNGKPIFDATKPAPTIGNPSDKRRWVFAESTGDIVAGVNTN